MVGESKLATFEQFLANQQIQIDYSYLVLVPKTTSKSSE